MNGRDRVVSALNRDLEGGPPFDLGSTWNTTITRNAYLNLKKALKIEDDKVKVLSLPLQIVQLEEEVLVKLGVDTRGLYAAGETADTHPKHGEFVDTWGIKYRPAYNEKGELRYYEMIEHPLSKAESLREIEDYFSKLQGGGNKFGGLRKRAQELTQEGQYAIVGHPGDSGIFENSWYLRGMNRFLVDLLLDRKMAEAVLEFLTDLQMEKLSRYLDEVGEYLHVVAVGDDLGGQQAPLISPQLYQEVVKPFHRKYFSLIKSKTKAKLHFHCCGAIAPLLPDLIDLGVDIINPVQVSAFQMDPAELKQEFGKDLIFWGAIDTHWVLPQGTVTDVKREVGRRIRELHNRGGYVVSAVHNIQDDVPAENILALAEAVNEHRREKDE